MPDAATKDFYGQPLVLVRPDQFVAWAGNDVTDAEALLRRVVGGRAAGDRRPPHAPALSSARAAVSEDSPATTTGMASGT